MTSVYSTTSTPTTTLLLCLWFYSRFLEVNDVHSFQYFPYFSRNLIGRMSWTYIPRSLGILVIILPCEVLLSALVSAIFHQQSSITINSVRPSMLQAVISIDLPHQGWASNVPCPSKTLSQFCHYRTLYKENCQLIPQSCLCGFLVFSPSFVVALYFRILCFEEKLHRTGSKFRARS